MVILGITIYVRGTKTDADQRVRKRGYKKMKDENKEGQINAGEGVAG